MGEFHFTSLLPYKAKRDGIFSRVRLFYSEGGLSWLTNGNFTKTKPANGAGGALHPTAESWVHPQKGIRTAQTAWTMPGETDTAAVDGRLLVSDSSIRTDGTSRG